MAYNDDEDKKKGSSGGSSSGGSSSGSSKSPDPKGGKPADYGGYVRYDYGGSSAPTQSDQPSGQYSGLTVHYSPSEKKTYSGTWNGGTGNTGSNRGAGTRGSSAYNKQQQQQTNTLAPQNYQQRIAQSNATAYGLQGISGINQRPDITSDGKWYAGEKPTDIEAAARIVALNGGDEMMGRLMQSRYDSKSEFYRPSAGITNTAVWQLKNLGVDIPEGGLTDEWFAKVIPMVTQYYNPAIDSTTGAPKKPRRGAPVNEKIAYWTYQAYGEQANTTKAQNEKAALMEEIAYYAGSDKNYSDEEIAAKIGWDKYTTLRKIDEGARDGVPLQLNADIGYSRDYLGGMIWAARNGGGTGDAFTDSVNALLGYGSGYQPDEETIKKRTPGTPEYAPYSLGPASKGMEEAGMYFGKQSFSNEEVEELAKTYMFSNNPSDVKMMQRVMEANDFTKACEEELDTLINGELDETDGKRYGGVDDKITEFLASNDTNGSSLDEIVNTLADEILDDGDYKNLDKLQSSMDKYDLKDTTRAIGYSKENLKKLLKSKLEARIETPTVKDATDKTKNTWDSIGESFGGLFSPKKPEPDEGELVQWKGAGDKAVQDSKQKTADGVTSTIMDAGTSKEKTTWRTSEVGQQDSADSMVPYVKKGIPTGSGADVYYNLTDSNINGTDYINNRNTINSYEGLSNQKKEIEDKLKKLQEEQDKRHSELSYDERMERNIAMMEEGAVKVASAGASDIGGGVFGKEQEAPSIENMSVSQKAAWLNQRMLAPSTTPEEYGELSFLRDRYLDSATLPPEQRQALDEELAEYMNAVQPTEDTELVGLRQDAVNMVARLNPEMKDASFEEAEAWLAKQSGDTNAFLDAKEAVEKANLTADLRVVEMQQADMQGAYDEAYDYMRKLKGQYDTLGTMWKITGSGGEFEQPASKVLDYVAQFGEYQSYPYDDTNYYDAMIRDGKDANEVYSTVRDDNLKYREVKEYIKGCMNACDQKGVDIPEEYRKNMQRAMDRLDNLIADGNYYALRKNDDFESFTEAQKKKDYEQDASYLPDVRASFDFMTDEQWQLTTLPGTDFAPVNIYAMTEDERNTLWYVYGKQGASGAQKYYNHLTDEYGAVTTRRGQEAEEDLYNAFRAMDKYTGNVGGTAATVVGHPAQVMGGLYTAFMWATGREANPNSSFYSLGKASSRERQSVKEDIAQSLTGQFGNGWWVDIATKGYDAVTSSADNIFDAVLMGGAGKALGITSPLVAKEGASIARKFTYNVINGTITALPLGVSAGGMAYVDAIARGLPPEKAYILAGASTLAESVTEGLEIESIIDAYSLGTSQGLKGFIEEVLTSAVNEAVGEGAGSIFEQGIDDFVSGKLSTRNQLKEQYRRQGLVGDELESAVNNALVHNVIDDMIMGAASGMLSTSFSGTVGGIKNTLETSKYKKSEARWDAILYDEFKLGNSEYLTNLENGYMDLGFDQEDAHQMAEDYARTVFEELKASTPESVAEKQAAALEQSVNTYRENKEVFNAQMETAVEESESIGTYDQSMGLEDVIAEMRGEPRINPRTEAEVENFERDPISQYDDLVDQLTDDADKGFDGTAKSEAVSTLQAALSYTAQAEDATDEETKAVFQQKAQAATKALDDILAKRGIDKARYRFLDNAESMMQLRQAMNAETQGPTQQIQAELDEAEDRLAQMLNEFDGSEESQAAINAQSDAVNAIAERLKNRTAADALAEQARGPETREVQGPVQALRRVEESVADTAGTTSEAQRGEQALQRQGMGRVTEEAETANPEGTTAQNQREEQALQRQGLGQVTETAETVSPEGTTAEAQRNDQALQRQGLGRVTEEETVGENEGTTTQDQRDEQALQRQGLGTVTESEEAPNPEGTSGTDQRLEQIRKRRDEAIQRIKDAHDKFFGKHKRAGYYRAFDVNSLRETRDSLTELSTDSKHRNLWEDESFNEALEAYNNGVQELYELANQETEEKVRETIRESERRNPRSEEVDNFERAPIQKEQAAAPEVNPVEAMETVNRQPAPPAPVQGPPRINPFTAEFAETLKERETMRGQALQLTETPTSEKHAVTMLDTVFNSVEEIRDAISDGKTMAAARELVSRFGMEDAVNAVRGILVQAANQNISNREAINAVEVAALVEDGEASRRLASIMANGATPNRVKALVTAAIQEAQTKAGDIQSAIKDGITNTILYRKASDGELAAVKPYEQSKAKAKEELRNAEWQLDTQQDLIDTAEEKLNQVQGPYLENPTDASLRARWKEAATSLDNAYSVLYEYQQRLRNKQVAYNQANAALADVYNREMTKLRQEASTEADAIINAARDAQNQRQQAQELAQRQELESSRARAQEMAWQRAQQNRVTQQDNVQETAQESADNAENAGISEETTAEIPANENAGTVSETAAETVPPISGQTNTNGEARAEAQAPNAPRNINIRTLRVSAEAQRGGTDIQSNAPENAPKNSPAQIAKNLMSDLHIGDYTPTKKMGQPRGTRAYYDNRAKYIAVPSSEIGNFEATMHEIGHAVSDMLGLDGTDQMIQNLPPEFINGYKDHPEELPGEAFGEFMWRYMMSDRTARLFAGDDFVDNFENRMEEAGIADAVHKAAEELRAFIGTTANNQINAVVRSASDKSSVPAVQRVKDFVRHLIAGNIDATSGAENLMNAAREKSNNKVAFEANVRQAGLMNNFSDKRASFILTEGMMDSSWTQTGGDGITQIFEKNNIKSREDYDMVVQYMLAKHSLDRDAQGKPVFSPTITPEARQALINDIESNHNNVVEAAKGIRAFWHDFMQYFMVDTGFLGKNGQEILDKWDQMYQWYVPTFRYREGTFTNGMKRSGFQVHEAKGSTEDIIDPIESMSTMVKSIVGMVSKNQTALALHNAMEQFDGLGEFARRIEPDKQAVTIDASDLKTAIQNAINSNGDPSALQDVLNALNRKQEETVKEKGVTVPNAISVQLADGSKVYYEVNDKELYHLLANTSPQAVTGALQKIGAVTRFMSAMTTGSNPVFAIRNAMRDFQTSVNWGSWATTYIDGLYKWAKAFYEVWTNSGDFQAYKALGGGGWLSINPTQKQSARELRNELIPGYETSTALGKARRAADKVSQEITLEKINEVIEQTSRYVEYKYGKHDLTTAEGRAEAFLAGQEASVDFARRGYADGMYQLKQCIPFFSAATQGVYRTARMFSKAERARLPARFAKTVFNTALRSALAATLLLKFGTDEEKFEFENMNQDIMSQHFFFPNFNHTLFGPKTLLRVPLAQDPLTHAVHGFITNAVWYGTTDKNVLDLLTIANSVIDEMNPMGNGTIFRPLFNVAQNKNHYGADIIPSWMTDLVQNPTAQYTADTPDFFIGMGRFTGKSPLVLQYLAEQYTGFLGQMLIPALSKDKNTGEIGGWRAAVAAAQGRITLDPLASAQAVSVFYNNYEMLDNVIGTVDKGLPLNMLRRGLSQPEANKAYADAKKLYDSTGVIGKARKQISELNKEIQKINSNPTLSASAKHDATTAIRIKITKLCLRANESAEQYREKYITGLNPVTAALYEGAYAEKKKKKKK